MADIFRPSAGFPARTQNSPRCDAAHDEAPTNDAAAATAASRALPSLAAWSDTAWSIVASPQNAKLVEAPHSELRVAFPFVPNLRHQVQELVGTVDDVDPAGVIRVGVEQVSGLVLEEGTDAVASSIPGSGEL